ncbi:MAG: helix-turn-helix domain-containing protein [Firmicutes bacterium]|nr:helix-turn-helix domain-containing protein [Bacillota bacterium]
MLGDRLKELRRKSGQTQAQLAVIFNMSRSTYAQYEVNRRNPDYNTLRMFANYFQVSTDFLLGVANDLVPPSEAKAPSDGSVQSIQPNASSDDIVTSIKPEEPSENFVPSIQPNMPSDDIVSSIKPEEPSENSVPSIPPKAPSDDTVTSINSKEPNDDTVPSIHPKASTNDTVTQIKLRDPSAEEYILSSRTLANAALRMSELLATKRINEDEFLVLAQKAHAKFTNT